MIGLGEHGGRDVGADDARCDLLQGDARQPGSTGDIERAVETLVDIQLDRDSLDDEAVVVGASAGVEFGGALRVEQVASEFLSYGAAVPWSIASRRSRIHMRANVVGPMPFF